FVHEVSALVHAELAIDLLGDGVGPFDIEPDAAYRAVVEGASHHFLVEVAVDAESPVPRSHVDALNPPELAVAPVAPLIGDHQAAASGSLAHGRELEAALAIGHHGGDAAAHSLRVQFAFLGLLRHGNVERGNGFDVGGIGLAHDDLGGSCFVHVSYSPGIVCSRACPASIL